MRGLRAFRKPHIWYCLVAALNFKEYCLFASNLREAWMPLFFTYFLPSETYGGKLRGIDVYYSASALPKFASISFKIEVFMNKTLIYNLTPNPVMKNPLASHPDTCILRR